MELLKARPLEKGDVIGLICPASAPLRPEVIDRSILYFEQRGFRVKLGPNARKQHGYLAGTDEERASDFNEMARDRDIRAIFAVRGGYGTPRILPLIDYRALRRDPKIVCGFSDLTALQCGILRKTGLVTFSGALPGVELWKGADAFTEKSLWFMLRSGKGPVRNPVGSRMECLRRGKAEGPLICANLSLLVSLLGTPFIPDLKGAILVLEEVGEEPYRVDRMFAQLRNAGVLERIAALVLGTFTQCEPKDPAKPHFTIDEVLRQVAEWTPAPVLANLQYGHVPVKLTLPIGCQARLDATRRRLEISETAVA